MFITAVKYTPINPVIHNEHQFEYIGNGCFYSQYEKVILNSRSAMNELPTKTKITGTQKIVY